MFVAVCVLDFFFFLGWLSKSLSPGREGTNLLILCSIYVCMCVRVWRKKVWSCEDPIVELGTSN
jgi:hypothetical protein